MRTPIVVFEVLEPLRFALLKSPTEDIIEACEFLKAWWKNELI